MESPEPIEPGDLVRIATGGPQLDGLVFELPSHSKAVVAVMDAKRGPVFRTVHPDTLTARAEAGPDDQALRLLVRRTPPPEHGALRGATGGGRGRPGHTRGAAHRSTGR